MGPPTCGRAYAYIRRVMGPPHFGGLPAVFFSLFSQFFEFSQNVAAARAWSVKRGGRQGRGPSRWAPASQSRNFLRVLSVMEKTVHSARDFPSAKWCIRPAFGPFSFLFAYVFTPFRVRFRSFSRAFSLAFACVFNPFRVRFRSLSVPFAYVFPPFRVRFRSLSVPFACVFHHFRVRFHSLSRAFSLPFACVFTRFRVRFN